MVEPQAAAQRKIGKSGRVHVVPESSTQAEGGRVVPIRMVEAMKSKEAIDVKTAPWATPGSERPAGPVEHGHGTDANPSAVAGRSWAYGRAGGG
jgi:hypothetical protein